MVALMSSSIIGLQMDANDARDCVAQINHHLNRVEHHANEARALIWELHARDGWKALGYASWRACVMAEFEQSSSSVYRQLNAALVELDLSPTGGIAGEINERVLRPLTKRGLDADSRHFVWQVCESIVGQGGKITSGITEAVVEGLEDIIRSGAYQDGNGEQRLYGEQMSADLTARIREVKLTHKQHVKRMDAKRDYIVGGRKTDSILRGTINDHPKVLVTVTLENSAEVEKLSEALRLGKPIYCSLWTED